MTHWYSVRVLRYEIFLEHSTAIVFSTADHILFGICEIWYSKDHQSYCKSMICQTDLQSFESCQWTDHCKRAFLGSLQLLHYPSFCNRNCSIWCTLQSNHSLFINHFDGSNWKQRKRQTKNKPGQGVGPGAAEVGTSGSGITGTSLLHLQWTTMIIIIFPITITTITIIMITISTSLTCQCCRNRHLQRLPRARECRQRRYFCIGSQSPVYKRGGC